MTRTYRVGPGVLVATLCLSVCLSTSLLAQRADRAVISGVVTDPQGAALPGATVTIHNQATGVDTILVTNAAGAYTSPPLVLGQYSVTVDMQGFKKAVTGGILLQGGEAVRNDVAMQVGGVQETVQVEGRTGIDVTTPDVAHTVNEAYYRALPIVTAADVRLAEAVLQIQPGFLPMRPNGDPMFRGSQFNSRINGGQTMATENFFDGAAFGYAVGHQQSHESTPPVEAVQEVKVISTSYSAQYGHTSGGFIEYTGKSGTNSYRGSLYDYVADDTFNSTGFFAKKAGTGPSPLSNNNYGATFGGPVKLFKYDGHNKTFFFVNYDYTRLRSGVLPGFGNTTPIDAFKNGDFSALLTGNQIAVDALGRPVLGGQIFNPATTRLVNGIPVRDPYPGNVIPANDPMRSLVASRIVPLMVHPDRPGISNNVAGNPAGDQTWELNARNIMTRVDHNFSKSFRGSTSFYWNHRPSVRNCGEVAGCAVPNNPETDPSKNTEYYGNGFFQRISTQHLHQQFDWIVRDNLLNHSTVAYDRWFMGGNNLAAGAQWPQRLWAGTSAPTGGILDTTGGPPLLSFDGNIPYNQLGQYGWPGFGFLVNNRWQFSDDLTWVKGRHTLKSGFEFRNHDFPFRGWAVGSVAGEFHFDRLGTAGFDANGNNLAPTGDPFASFLVGQVQTANQTIPVEPTFHETYTAGWINDEFKVSNKLTLTLGLRFDYQAARTEANDQVLDVRSEHAESRCREPSGRADLCGRWSRTGRDTDVRRPAEGRMGAAHRRRLSRQRPERPPRRLRYLLRARRVRSVRRAADARVPGERPGGEHDQRDPAGVPPRSGIPGQRHSAAAVHRSHVRPGDGAHRGRERRTDAAPVPELVDHLRARIDPQHDGGRVVHRQSRQPSEPSLADTGRRCQHELARRAVAGNGGPTVGRQLGSGAPGRHSVAVPGLQRQRGTGAQKVSAVPEHHLARRADR